MPKGRKEEPIMRSKYFGAAAATCASALLLSTALSVPAAAQGYGQPGSEDAAPPQGQYAEPPPGSDQGGDYDDQSQQQDEAYAQSYSEWAARYCVNQANNT